MRAPRCSVCGERIPKARRVAAESRGTPAKYCSTRCRETANKRAVRQRARERAQAAPATPAVPQTAAPAEPIDDEPDDDAPPSPIDEFLDELDDLAVRRANRAP